MHKENSQTKITFRHSSTELEETIQAIRSGQIDALVIETSSGDQVFTIEKSSSPSVEELREVLHAIRNGQVDALVVTTPSGDRIFTLEGADQPYRIFMETMQEGAATLDEDGTVLYANARFAEIIGVPLEKFMGVSLSSHAESEDEEKMRRLLQQSRESPTTAEVIFKTSRGRNRLRLSFSALPTENNESKHHAVCVVASDVTELFEASESLRKKEEALKQLSARLMKSQDEERGGWDANCTTAWGNY
jgi:PAS domain S-box-containing protein